MRIISGKYKGRRIQPPRKFHSRPTTDMAKEGLFNILESKFYWEGKEVLDLFAGTGNVSVEFLSRGVQEVLSVDQHDLSIRHMNKVQDQLEIENWSILKKDVFKFIEHCHRMFDIVFADPPFAMKQTATIPDVIFEAGILKEEGTLILEHGQENEFKNHSKLKDSRRYGGVYFSFFE